MMEHFWVEQVSARISQHIVQLHGGRLEAEFAPEGGKRMVMGLLVTMDPPADVP